MQNSKEENCSFDTKRASPQNLSLREKKIFSSAFCSQIVKLLLFSPDDGIDRKV